jgi:hypothetical protein
MPRVHLALAGVRGRPLGGGLLLPESVRGWVQQRVVARLQPPVDAPHLRAGPPLGLAGCSERPPPTTSLTRREPATAALHS